MKITYKTNVLDVIRLVENNTPALWKKEWNNFPNTWGGVNALTKKVVKDLLVMINLPYSKELAGFIRYIVEYPNTISYSEYKRSLIGKTIEDVIFEPQDGQTVGKTTGNLERQVTYNMLILIGY